MTREQALLCLADRLRASSMAGDWPALARADLEVADGVRRLAGQGVWSPAEESALARLHGAHRDATRICSRQVQQASARLHELGERKDGWMAYAVSEWEGEQS